VDAIERWRAEEGWLGRVQRIRPLLDDLQASTLDPVVDLH
jgi:hypothetical protein